MNLKSQIRLVYALTIMQLGDNSQRTGTNLIKWLEYGRTPTQRCEKQKMIRLFSLQSNYFDGEINHREISIIISIKMLYNYDGNNQ